MYQVKMSITEQRNSTTMDLSQKDGSRQGKEMSSFYPLFTYSSIYSQLIY